MLASELVKADVVIRAVVRRCNLSDYKPNYLVGVQFQELDPLLRGEG